MKSKLNKIITIVVIYIFIIYLSLVLSSIDRKYFFVEKIFKGISSRVNTFIINNMYNTNNGSYNIVSSRINYLEKENELLRKEASLKQNNTSYLLSEIINHNSKLLLDRVIINNGYNDNIKKDNAVITSDGLVGFISKTSKNISEVTLLPSILKNNKISVIIKADDDVLGILSDYDIKNNLFIVKDVTSKSNIKAGDTVVLAGYNNDIYKGIHIGKVYKEENNNYGLSKNIYVESNVNFNDLLFVSVVIDK